MNAAALVHKGELTLKGGTIATDSAYSSGLFVYGEGKATVGLVYLIGSLWLVNGYLQGMGVPPCVSLLSHWIRPKELPTKQSIWNTSHSIGAGLVVLLCGFLLTPQVFQLSGQFLAGTGKIIGIDSGFLQRVSLCLQSRFVLL